MALNWRELEPIREVLESDESVPMDRVSVEGVSQRPAAEEHGARLSGTVDRDGTLERIHHTLYVARAGGT
jgi:hypothetical protein